MADWLAAVAETWRSLTVILPPAIFSLPCIHADDLRNRNQIIFSVVCPSKNALHDASDDWKRRKFQTFLTYASNLYQACPPQQLKVFCINGPYQPSTYLTFQHMEE